MGDCCAGPDSNKIADKIDRSTFDFQPNQDKCGGVSPSNAVSNFFGRPATIFIGSSAFLPTLCGAVENTVVHEGAHLTLDREKKADQIGEKCFGPGSVLEGFTYVPAAPL